MNAQRAWRLSAGKVPCGRRPADYVSKLRDRGAIGAGWAWRLAAAIGGHSPCGTNGECQSPNPPPCGAGRGIQSIPLLVLLGRTSHQQRRRRHRDGCAMSGPRGWAFDGEPGANTCKAEAGPPLDQGMEARGQQPPAVAHAEGCGRANAIAARPEAIPGPAPAMSTSGISSQRRRPENSSRRRVSCSSPVPVGVWNRELQRGDDQKVSQRPGERRHPGAGCSCRRNPRSSPTGTLRH